MAPFFPRLPRRTGALLLALLPAAALAQNLDTLVSVRTAVSGVKVSRLSVFKGGGLLLGGDYTGDDLSNSIPATGTGTRLMWYPEKAAFRAGYVNGTQWEAPNIGAYSIAAGYNARASGDYATAFGKEVTAAQINSFAEGEYCTASGAASVALGYGAHTNARQGSFVFSDRSLAFDISTNGGNGNYFRATTNHTANWRVVNGFRIVTSVSNPSGAELTGVTIQNGSATSNWNQTNAVISTSTGAMLTTSGVWQNNSDRRKKHRLEAVSGEDVLRRLRQLPITRWSYKVDQLPIRHLGPMAQDFYKAFGLGNDSISIGTVDADGVALAGVQALDARTQSQAARLTALAAENQELRTRLDALERRALAPTPPAAGTPLTSGLPLAAGLLLAGAGVGAVLRRRA
jgi:hypothetical protein